MKPFPEKSRNWPKARAGLLTPDDADGATFTISNLGMYGIESFTPIVNLPQSAILGLNSIVETPIAAGDALIRTAPIMKLSLTVDHRVVDGAVAAKMLHEVKTLAENPWKLLL